MSSERPNYRAYLLRLWREHSQAPWRASLQSSETRERHNFASLASLIAFLETQTGQSWVSDVGGSLSAETDSLTDPNLPLH